MGAADQTPNVTPPLGGIDAPTAADFKSPPQLLPSGEKPGEMVGPYRLLELVGEGGFGSVWLAERREPIVQRVALKILNPGMDSREILARFEQERQALAVMNHPNVAMVIDAGATAAGRPYFAMEYVRGESITAYCDRHRLNIRERLELFIPVCEAVQHAHHKGIIHRDLKPSNILVSVHEGRAVPKVIDFGVAKAVSHTLTQKTIFTEHGRLIGTPEYMSPEQAEMGATDVDTRTDVYALGVVLYELLSGLLPFDAKMLREGGMLAICRIIREQEPPRPSTRLSTIADADSTTLAISRHTQREHLARELRRELDWIPLKAIRKDRAERYDSPMDLAQDIERYLKGEALEAGPESAGYRLRKLVRRNKGPAIAVGAVVLALAIGLAGTLWKEAEARKESLAARAAEAEQRRLATSEAEARSVADAKTGEAEKALAKIEFNAYVSNIQLAAAEMEFRRFERVRSLLDACPTHLRGWEWRWLNGCADNSLLSLEGHTDKLRGALFSPDGALIVTSSEDGTARVWDAVTGTCVAILKGHTERINRAQFSPDGKMVVTSSNDGTAKVWDAKAGVALSTLNGHSDRVYAAEFSPDGVSIVTSSADGTARVWDAASGTEVHALRGHTSWVGRASFSADGKKIVTAGGDRTARVWDAATGASIAELKGHSGNVARAVFSPDGTRIVTSSEDQTARVWHADSGTALAVFKGHGGPVFAAAFSPDGKWIATGSADGSAQVWNAQTGEILAELKGHKGPIYYLSYNPDGSQIVTASQDQTARIWRAYNGELISALQGHKAPLCTSTFSPDGTRVVTSSEDGTARIWDSAASFAAAETLTYSPGDPYTSAEWSSDGRRIVTVTLTGPARLWEVTNRDEVLDLDSSSVGELEKTIGASFSPDGMRIVAVSPDGTVRICDANTGAEVARLNDNSVPICRAKFNPDGTRIITASRDGSARLWNANTSAAMLSLKGHREQINDASFSPDGSLVVTASDDGTARIWNTSDGSEVIELKGHNGKVHSARFSSDGKRIITASADRTARLWDSVHGFVLSELKGHSGDVTDADLSPDGKRIVTASADRMVRVWDASTGVLLSELKGHESGVASARFSPDGTRLVTASDDGTVRFWTGVPLHDRFPAVQRFRDAKKKVSHLVASRLRSGESVFRCREWISRDPSLDSDNRLAALAVAQEIKGYADVSSLPAFIFGSVSASGDLLQSASEGFASLPGEALQVTTYGIMLYRTGHFPEAIDMLQRAESVNASAHQIDQKLITLALAFRAMAHWKMSEPIQARSELARLRDLAAQNKWKAGSLELEALQDSEKLIDGSR